jgi:heme A synthase
MIGFCQLISAFFVYSGARIVLLVRGNNSIRLGKNPVNNVRNSHFNLKQVSRMAKLILVSGICLLVTLIGIIMVFTDVNQRTPQISFGINQLIFGSVCIMSLMMVLLFAPPNSNKTDSSEIPNSSLPLENKHR